MTDTIIASTIEPTTAPLSRLSVQTARHLLGTLADDLAAIDTAEAASSGIRAMAMVFDTLGLTSLEECIELQTAAVTALNGEAADEDRLVELLLPLRPQDWGYCLWLDRQGSRGNCAQINPPSGTPAMITNGFSKAVATARAIVKAHQQVLEATS